MLDEKSSTSCTEITRSIESSQNKKQHLRKLKDKNFSVALAAVIYE